MSGDAATAVPGGRSCVLPVALSGSSAHCRSAIRHLRADVCSVGDEVVGERRRMVLRRELAVPAHQLTGGPRAGEPLDPAELREHRCLHYGYLESGSRWRLTGPDGDRTYAIRCVMWSNNGEALKDAAIHDQGVALLPTFIVGGSLQAGELRTVLPGYAPPEIALCAMYPRHRHLSAKVKLFVEMLEQRFGGRPYWDLVE